MRRYLIVLLMILVMLGACGCSMEHGNETAGTTHNVNLTRRQIQILEQEGLPTDYELLNVRQQQAICAIEEMMAAVEAKYQTEFGYISYSDGGSMEAEEVTLYPKNGDRDTDVFYVSRKLEDGAYVYEDGYAAMLAKPVLAAFIQSYAQQYLGEDAVKVYSVIFFVDESQGTLTQENAAHHVDGNSWLFADGAQVTQAQLEDFSTAYRAWCADNGITGSTELILLKPEELKFVTRYNYSDYLSEKYYEVRFSVTP